ncbi:hypothetical protein CI15_00330 [Paraburkholderia monticola]|uniref:Uncharacterized protein n=1 Tax=Paraburkholderia monticola TaxID=1399968 RepID=A0A149Q173_9BURK|nr:toprim domain-containing protein [Paraburkholderia monticola]KXU91080.1 hypothetical protein CI15_00330 [Paraburkholderia monticola]
MIQWNDYDVGEHRIQCPACGRGPRDKTCGLTIKLDYSGVAHCHRCSFVETYRPERGAHIAAPSTPRITGRQRAPKRETLSDYGCDLWDACEPLKGSVAVDYLASRKCVLPPDDGDLRQHPNLKHPSGYVGPALVARVTDAVTGDAISLHRTWVRADGRKAYVGVSRMLLAGHRKQGGVIRLWPDEAATSTLGIAEGIESALSLAWAVQPVWALIDAGNLAKLPVLAGIETLVIAKDNDPAGVAAADECGRRWVEAGAEVLVSQQTENDLNDTILEMTV